MSRRQQILDRAAELFAARGFHGVSMADIGAACGISGPALYRHFASKDAMLAEMLVSVSERLLAVGRQRAAQAGTAEEALRALVRWHVEFALRHRPLIVLQDRDWDALSGEARDEVRRLQRDYVELWVAALQATRDPLEPDRGRAMAHAAFGLINSTPRASYLPEPQMAELLEGMAMRALAVARIA